MDLLFSVFFHLILAHPGKMQPVLAEPKLDTAKVVSEIKTEYLKIDAQRKSFSLFTPMTKVAGQSFFGYMDGTKLRMISVGAYADTAKVEADEYLDKDGKIIMIYAKQSIYETPLSINSRSKIKTTIDTWYYFHEETLVKWVSGGKVIPSGSAKFKNMGAQLQKELANHKKQFADIGALQKIR